MIDEDPLPCRRGPRDITLELPDREFLLRDDGLDHISYRNDANQLVVLEHWQVADAFIGHQHHTFFDRLLGEDAEHVRAHDFLYGSTLGRLPFQNHLPGVIPFRDDAHQLSAFAPSFVWSHE